MIPLVVVQNGQTGGNDEGCDDLISSSRLVLVVAKSVVKKIARRCLSLTIIAVCNLLRDDDAASWEYNATAK